MCALPANAKRIRYLECADAQYIDTGIYPTPTMTFEIDASVPAPSGSNTLLFGSREPGANVGNYYVLFFSGSGVKTRWAYGNGTPAETYTVFATGNRLVYSNVDDKTILKTGALSVQCNRSSSFSQKYNIYLFTANLGTNTPNSQYAVGAKIYSAKFFDNGTLVRSFVPVRVGTVGYLFDRVSGQLFGNSGTGDFVCGPDTFATGVLPTRMCVMGPDKT